MRRLAGVALMATAVTGVALASCDKKPNTTAQAGPAPTAVSSVFQSGPPQSAPMPAAASGPALAQGLAVNGKAQAEVVEATRQAGVLTVRVRFQRTAGADSIETIYGGTPDRDAVYVVAGANKLFPLTDAADKPLMTPDFFLRLGAGNPVAGIWFGKFPAPPAEVKSISLVLPKTDPLDNIAVADR